MGHVQHGIPEELARRLVRSCGLSCALETGTFRGDTTIFLRSLVEEVWTVESDPTLSRVAQNRFGSQPGIYLHSGPSEQILGPLAPSIEGAPLVWLDAHALPDGRDDQGSCPVLEEIRLVDQIARAASACILIDDARLFMGPHMAYPGASWPTFIEIVDAVRANHERYVTVLDDVIIAVPESARPTVDQWWLELSRSRNGNEHYSVLWLKALDPKPTEAAKRLAVSVARSLVRTSRRMTKPGRHVGPR